MAASCLAECLVALARQGDEAIDVVHAFCQRVPIDVIPLDVEIATHAARIRDRHRSLRLPAALVIATAVVGGADELLTTDRGWPEPKALDLEALIRVL